MSHLLVTNDFPPKTGGIQSYLWELWRRLPPGEVHVLTTPYRGAAAFDAAQPFPIERVRQAMLLPSPAMARRVDQLASRVGAGLVLLDPALPIGLIGPRLEHPYGVILHGAEVTVPGRLPGSRSALAHVLRHARVIVAAGEYPAAEAAAAVRATGGGLPPVVIVPPGVDVERFHPLGSGRRAEVRERLGVPADAQVVLSQSRLVPRKGMDVLIDAAAEIAHGRPDLAVLIGGTGRDRSRLEARAERRGAPVRFLGWVADRDLPDVYGCADVFAMLCRNRWAGLEQEGFGIVFLEAAACGVPQVAGDSGGAADAVVDGETGIVVRRPDRAAAVAGALARLLDDEEQRLTMGKAARERAVREFNDDRLAARLLEGLRAVGA